MQYQIPTDRRRYEGATVQQTSVYQPNQPELRSFAERQAWRFQLGAPRWIHEQIAGPMAPFFTNGIDWVSPVVDVYWL